MSDIWRRTGPCEPTCYRECQCSRWPDLLDRWGNPVRHTPADEPPETFDLYIDWLNGNDANDGLTEATALRTLTHCLAVHAVNGSKIGVLGHDVLNETYREYDCATALTNITIKAVPGNTPVFTPCTEYTVWAPTGGTANVYQTAYVIAWVYNVWNGADELTLVANVAACDALTNSYFFDNPGNLLHVNIGGAAPTSIEVFYGINPLFTSVGAGFTFDGITHQWSLTSLVLNANACTVQNCTFRYFSGYGALRTIINVTAGTGTVIDNCSLSGNTTANGNYGVRTTGTAASVTVSNCTLSSLYYGIGFDTAGGHIASICTLSNMGYDGITTPNGTATISYCTAYDCHHAGYIFVGAAANVTAHHCVYYTPVAPLQTNWHGFVVENGATAELYHCVSVDCTNDGFYVLVGGATATVNNCAAIGCDIGFRHDNTAGAVTANYNGVFDSITLAYGGLMPWAPGANDVALDPLMAGLPSDVTTGPGSPYHDAGTFIAGISQFGPPTDIGADET